MSNPDPNDNDMTREDNSRPLASPAPPVEPIGPPPPAA